MENYTNDHLVDAITRICQGNYVQQIFTVDLTGKDVVGDLIRGFPLHAIIDEALTRGVELNTLLVAEGRKPLNESVVYARYRLAGGN